MWPFSRKAKKAPIIIGEVPAQGADAPGQAKSTRTAEDVLRQLEAEERPKMPTGRVDANLARCLLAEGPVTQEFLRRQIAVGGKGDTYLGRLLALAKAPRETDLFQVLAAGCQVPEIDLKQCKVHVAVAHTVPREVALKYQVVAIDRVGDLLCVVFAGQPNPKALEAVRRATGLHLKAFRCPAHHVEILVRRLYTRGGAAPAPAVVQAVPVAEQEAAEARVEARWESLHASKGPVSTVRLDRR